MKIQKPVQLFACLAVAVIAALFTAPSPAAAFFQLDANSILAVLAVKTAFQIGAALGQASRSKDLH